ncbi:glutamine amidotransferase [Rubripirellula reticaptiva]|uniref:Putative glutamine amidotransferase domain-containing protein n=1 Tax=Rubripirellula reticaptiva TaxID=2528013 RepID=A0A5C6EHU1_9BACT|nr:glutamine amidotransferase [Rubripirellula reticaptiva]TWU49353.1 hypothetical protein Poly59_39680 [Rubripirellula reticaptiva]
MTSLAIEPIYGSLLLAMAAVATTVAVIVMVTPPTSDPRRRRWLIGLRLLAAVALLLALIRPTMVRTDNRPLDAALVVAIDTSRSMTLPDGDGSDRWSTQMKSWQSLASGLSGHDTSLDLRLLAYDASARPLASTSPDALSGVLPEGESTDLQAAAAATISVAAGQPIAGVVMMGDGAQTGPITGGGAGRVIETLNSLGIPFWTVPIGPARTQSQSRDVAIDALPEDYQLFTGNQVDITFQVNSKGMSGKDIPVRLTWIDEAGQRTEAATRRVAINKSVDVAAVTIPVTSPIPGTYQLQASADVQDGELVVTNNSQLAFVDVREGGGRILYLFSNLDQEQSLIRRALRRFPDLDLTFRWIPTDTNQSWPVDLQNWFTPGQFDIYLIGDLDAKALGNRQLEQLAKTIGQGAGLVTLGGYQTYGAGGYASSPLADVIPIKMDASRRRGIDSPLDSYEQVDAPVTIQLARNHPITDLGNRGSENDSMADAWRDLPALLGANKLLGPKIAPGVEVLLETPQSDPLLVVGQYGRGRAAALAMDSTWRWWRSGSNDQHRRFWRQLMLWLLSREESADDKILVELDSRRFSSGALPNFRAIANQTDVTMVAEIISTSNGAVDEAAQPQSINVSAETSSQASGGSDESSIRGAIPKLDPGIYRLRVRASDPASPIKSTEVAFQVIDESRELSNPLADPVYLTQLAQLTGDHGGAAFGPDQIGELVDTILKRRKAAETPVTQRLTLGDGPMTGWPLFLVFAAALSIEWWLRRHWGLA